MITDALLLLACGVYLLSRGASRLLPRDGRLPARASAPTRRSARARDAVAAAGATSDPLAARHGAAHDPELPGTWRLLRRDRGFLRRFGLDPAQVPAVRVYARPGALAELPVPLRERLQRLVTEGRCRGPEVSALALADRELAVGEQLYFARIEPPAGDAGWIAFVDRVRL